MPLSGNATKRVRILQSKSRWGEVSDEPRNSNVKEVEAFCARLLNHDEDASMPMMKPGEGKGQENEDEEDK